MKRSGRPGHYDPNQPRVAAGNPGGGRWTDAHRPHSQPSDTGDGDRLVVEPAQLQLLQRPLRYGIQRGIEAALALFTALSARNTPEQRAVFDFNAREFLRDPHAALDPRNATVLTRKEVGNVCEKLDDVQERTDRIASAIRTHRPNLNAQQFGTAVHAGVAHEINEPLMPDGSPRDPNYRAEVSYWKMMEDDVYGRKDSIRIDVLEHAGRRVVCVYDIKTGQGRRSGLDLYRMLEIVKNVLGAYPDVERIIITEVRPRR